MEENKENVDQKLQEIYPMEENERNDDQKLQEGIYPMEENMHHLLLDAALNGDVIILRDLIGQDPLLLRRPSKIQPLHVSSKSGHLEFTEELLRLNPSLAKELDPTDKSSPLHLASGHGHLGVVKALAGKNPGMCLARDMHGMNPAHVAAINGHVLVLGELIRAVPAVSRERVRGGGESILHLCIKYNKLEALSAAVAMLPAGDAGMLLNAKDGDGNTILHIAMADQRLEIINFLLNDDRVDKNKQNVYGWTAKDIFKENNKNVNTLIQAKVKLLSSKEINNKKEEERLTSWFRDQRNSLMVVASLVATMAFQAGLTPPFEHLEHTTAEEQIIYGLLYKQFIIVNTMGMVSSMSSIILLISRLPGRRFFIVVVMVMMWMAVSCMAYTYAISLLAKSVPLAYADLDNDYYTAIWYFWSTYTAGVVVWACGMALILLWHLTAWTVKHFKKHFSCRLGRLQD